MPADASSRKRRTPGALSILRYGSMLIALCLLLTGVIYASQRVEQFLILDPHFTLPGPPDYGVESPNLELKGVRYASRTQVLRAFEPDYGRSLYFFPLAPRRKALLKIAWVRDASIIRIWPNRILVEIAERKPVAFIKVPADGMARWALIDENGIILEPPPKAAFRLPLLTGVSTRESPEQRAARVRRMQRLIQELGPLAGNVSEVDASDLDNLKIVEQMNNRTVTLLLGDQNFAWRVRSFREHYAEIHRKLPKAVTFDLRLDDRITGLEGAGDGR
jgi:cell division protein FtsQ